MKRIEIKKIVRDFFVTIFARFLKLKVTEVTVNPCETLVIMVGATGFEPAAF